MSCKLRVKAGNVQASLTLVPMSERPPHAHSLTRPLFFVAGLAFVGLGIVGYILPVMPGTVFLILAAMCFARSSRRLEVWLLRHPRLGPTLVAWRENGAIPRRIKFIAIGSMIISMGLICLTPAPEWVDWAVGGVMVASALFVATRPEGSRSPG